MCAKYCRFAASFCAVPAFRGADTVCNRLNNHVDAKTVFHLTTIDEPLSSAAKSAYATLDSLLPWPRSVSLGTTSAIHHETGDEDG